MARKRIYETRMSNKATPNGMDRRDILDTEHGESMKASGVTFRFAERRDADGLHKNLFGDRPLTVVTQDLASDVEMMEQGRMIRVIGDCKGEPVSNVQVYYSKDHPLFSHRAEMHTVHVSPAYRRKGVATAMLKHALGVATRDNVEIVTVWVDGDNTPALNLYEKCGFSSFGRLDRGIKRADGFSDYVLMKIDLSE
jgi:ribosomal protein S18 acetylase RimI-like enzyme